MFSMLLCIWRFFRLVKPLVDHTPKPTKNTRQQNGRVQRKIDGLTCKP